MRSKYEVVVVGGGPSGLVAATQLSRAGKQVILLERNREIGPKICGGGLAMNVTSFEVPVELADKRFSAIVVHRRGRRRRVALPNPYLMLIKRERLGSFLLQKALTSGVAIETGMPVTEVSATDVSCDGHKIAFRHLIGADGSNSVVRRYLGLPVSRLGVTLQLVVPREHRDFAVFFDPWLFGSGFAWVLPYNGFSIVGLGWDSRESSKRSLRTSLADWCRQENIDVSQGTQQSWPINIDYRGLRFGNVFLVGDAAGLASGLTGMGIYNGMVSGQEAARLILDPDYDCAELKRILRKKRAQEILLRLLQTGRTIPNLCQASLLALAANRLFRRMVIGFLL